jgi:hypothetical protein
VLHGFRDRLLTLLVASTAAALAPVAATAGEAWRELAKVDAGRNCEVMHTATAIAAAIALTAAVSTTAAAESATAVAACDMD